LTCPADITVDNDPGQCGAIVNFAATATDNCPSTVTITYSQDPGTQFPVGTTVVTAIATDGAGQTASCTFNVTVNDAEDPTITCPIDITQSNDPGVCDAFVTIPIPVTSDTCSIANALDFDGADDLVSLNLPSVFTNLATSDFTAEMWIFHRNSEFERLFFAQQDSSNYATAATSNSGVIFFYVVVGGTTYSLQTNATVPLNSWTHVAMRWTASTATPEIFINGTLAPGTPGGSSSLSTDNVMTLGSKLNATQSFNGQIDEFRLWSSAQSNADIASNSNSCIDPMAAGLEVYYTLDQTSGNTTAMDSTGNGNTGTLINMDPANDWVAGTVECPLLVVNDFTGTENASGTYPVGTTTVNYTVTDRAGNTATCSFDVTINDTEAPVAVCQDITVQLDAAGMVSIVAADVDGGSTDNCGIAGLSVTPSTFTCADVGPNTVTLTVTDTSGNSSTCTAIVTPAQQISQSIMTRVNVVLS